MLLRARAFWKALGKESQKGMSLIEILIALTLLALAGTFVVSKVFDQFEEGRRSSAIIQIQNFKGPLNNFRRHCGYFPTSEQGLDALINKPTGGKECKRYQPGGYVDGGKVPADPWEFDFDYQSDGKKYTIISYGADGEEGGEGWDADINSDKL
jgi:general secretion pathway protein G